MSGSPADTPFTQPGDTVLDPFLGSGTTGAVSRRLGCHFIGIEKMPAYIAVAKERIFSVQPQFEGFDA